MILQKYLVFLGFKEFLIKNGHLILFYAFKASIKMIIQFFSVDLLCPRNRFPNI